jgi:hypothetical protein
MTDEENKAFRPEQVKKPYRAPDLHEYGSIQEITRVHARAGANDHGKSSTGNDMTGL